MRYIVWMLLHLILIQCNNLINQKDKITDVQLPENFSGIGYVIVDSSMQLTAKPIMNGHILLIPQYANPSSLTFYRGDSLLNPDYLLIKTNTWYCPKHLRGNGKRVESTEYRHIYYFYVAKNDIEVMMYRQNPTQFEIQINSNSKRVLDSLVMNDIVR